jgi:hypothetical protein
MAITRRSVTVGWSQVATAKGYKIYWGTHTRSYNYHQDVGQTTKYTLGNLVHNTTYYISGKAYNQAGNSIFGNELIFKA